MKNLTFEQTEQVNGGSWGSCIFAMSLVVAAESLTYATAGAAFVTIGGAAGYYYDQCSCPFNSMFE